MKYSLIVIFLILLSEISQAQFDSFQIFDGVNNDGQNELPVLLELSEENLIMFYIRNDSLFSSKTTDNGINWLNENFIYETDYPRSEIGALILNSGRIYVYIKRSFFVGLYSDDNGNSWTEVPYLPMGNSFTRRLALHGSVTQLNNGDMYFLFAMKTDNLIRYIKSTDEGETWSERETIFPITSNSIQTYPFLTELSDGSQLLFYLDEIDGLYKIFSQRKNTGGSIWFNRQLIFESETQLHKIKYAKDNSGMITVSFEDSILIKEDPEYNYIPDDQLISDIYYLQSDNGQNWTQPIKLTNYPGFDGNNNLTSTSERTLVSLSSDRESDLFHNNIWYGEIGVTEDTSYSPIIFFTDYSLPNQNSIKVESKIYDDGILDSVILNYSINSSEVMTQKLYDDGALADSIAGDHLYTIQLNDLSAFDKIQYTVSAFDNDANMVQSPAAVLFLPSVDVFDRGIIDVNNILLPVDNRGVLADVHDVLPSGWGSGFYDDEVFLFSAGFYLTGYSNGELWSNGVSTTDRVEDYQPGLMETDPSTPINLLYQVRSSDPPFSFSWHEWKNAVLLGAKFYDGDNDGNYEPIDLNSNGAWDFNEDRPDLLGDQTFWCVYNDGVPTSWRKYNVTAQGIEIRQSVYASNGNGSMYDDIIFVRYEISNTGSAAVVFDSVYFAALVDPDIGEFMDDLVASDTVEQSGIAYNTGEDDVYGINPPAFFVKQLQGPPVFIAGETFIDNNSDNEFTFGIDTPLDSAIAKSGKYLGEKYIPGAKNGKISAYTAYHGITNYDHPQTKEAARNYLRGGLNTIGEHLDPCTWMFGNGASLLNCHQINPKFMYSGDPVSGEGWLTIVPKDQIFVLSTGPFKIKVGEPVELIYAYIVGRGTDHLNSITKAREISQFAQTVYDNNFEDLPTGFVDDENLIADEFKLYQNYPNPFNPTTKIKFELPNIDNRKSEIVTLTIYDILGREIKTLINEQKPAGIYELQFDASKLSSGVYFYQLSAGSFVKTRKLMFLK